MGAVDLIPAETMVSSVSGTSFWRSGSIEGGCKKLDRCLDLAGAVRGFIDSDWSNLPVCMLKDTPFEDRRGPLLVFGRVARGSLLSTVNRGVSPPPTDVVAISF